MIIELPFTTIHIKTMEIQTIIFHFAQFKLCFTQKIQDTNCSNLI